MVEKNQINRPAIDWLNSYQIIAYFRPQSERS